MRRVIQISVGYEYSLAVCDDGSLWELNSGEWLRLADIPQDEQHENKVTFEKINPERKD